ncbi:thioredoxin family protein [Venatoribacter cucullus]|uniref:thioredoxin family protein n=1 Tax=Venatoribacter cucullus TaxID=2661630 RepID=UPI002240AD26|nr:thioredoxin domain-containing protein [Venatoribacter cucullus]UZK03559.1 hypothetical protein GAY96_06455 [Venatoribacter cucullus]
MPSPTIVITDAEQLRQWQQGAGQPWFLLLFTTAGCAPCRALLPVLEQTVQSSDQGLVLLQVDAGQLSPLAQQYQVRSVPQVLLFQGPRLWGRLQGLQTRRQVDAFLQAVMPQPDAHSLPVPASADIAGLRRAAAQAALIQSLLQQAHRPALLAEARQRLQQLPDELLRDPELARLQSLLHWLERPVPAGCEWRVAAHRQVADGHFNAAVETLLQVPQLVQRSDLQALLVELLNVLPDRQAANGYRRRLFALLA